MPWTLKVPNLVHAIKFSGPGIYSNEGVVTLAPLLAAAYCTTVNPIDGINCSANGDTVWKLTTALPVGNAVGDATD